MEMFLYLRSLLMLAIGCTHFSSIVLGFASQDTHWQFNLLHTSRPLEGLGLPLWFPALFQYTQGNQECLVGFPSQRVSQFREGEGMEATKICLYREFGSLSFLSIFKSLLDDVPCDARTTLQIHLKSFYVY